MGSTSSSLDSILQGQQSFPDRKHSVIYGYSWLSTITDFTSLYISTSSTSTFDALVDPPRDGQKLGSFWDPSG